MTPTTEIASCPNCGSVATALCKGEKLVTWCEKDHIVVIVDGVCEVYYP